MHSNVTSKIVVGFTLVGQPCRSQRMREFDVFLV